MNLWSLLGEDNADAAVAAGQKALASGAVSPDEAQKNLQSIGPWLSQYGHDPVGFLKKKPASSPARAKITVPPKTQAPLPPAVPQAAPLPGQAPMAKGSGMTAETQNTSTLLDKAVEARNEAYKRDAYLSPEEQEQLYAQTEQLAPYKSLQPGIKEQEDILDAAKKNPTMDLGKAFAAAAAYEHNGDNSAIVNLVNAPLDADKQKLLMALSDKLQNSKEDYAKNVREGMRTSRAGVYTNSLNNTTTDALTQRLLSLFKAQDPAAMGKAPNNTDQRFVYTAYQKEAKPMMDQLRASQQAQGILNSKNPIGDAGMPILLAMMEGTGKRVTNGELTLLNGSPAVRNRIERKIDKWSSGILPEEDRADMLALARAVEYQSKEGLKNTRQQALDAGEAFGVPRARVDKMLPQAPGLTADKLVQGASNPKKAPGHYTPGVDPRLDELMKKYPDMVPK